LQKFTTFDIYTALPHHALLSAPPEPTLHTALLAMLGTCSSSAFARQSRHWTACPAGALMARPHAGQQSTSLCCSINLPGLHTEGIADESTSCASDKAPCMMN
jgi:hypothetical protein